MRRLALAALTTVTAVTTTVAVTGAGEGASASVAVSQVYRVPDSGRFTVRGHGWGHGHGMSQHGAQGAARKGLNAQQILAFYYPGTRRTIAADGLIRVLITADTSDPVAVRPRSGLSVRDLGPDGTGTTTYSLPTTVGARTWRVRASTADRDRVQYYDGKAWRAWRPGGRATLLGRGELFSPDGPVALIVPGATVLYRGALRSAAPTPGSTARDTVNVLSLDDYVKGVIPAEMPASWEPAAVRAQAVAARTYAVYDREAHPTRYYDTCDTTMCQVYRGVAVEDSRSNDAADRTAGQIRTLDGKAIFSQFSSSNGGWTSQGSVAGKPAPYLAHKQDPYDGWAGNTNHSWSTTLAAGTISRAYPTIGRLLRVRVRQREGGGDWQGRVEKLVLVGTKGSKQLSGDEFRSRFGLKSTWFRL
ncbi:SpoIID/LytB domain-containing protein [Nocardioides marmoribigeumensis]|uniref:SpoIID/LytB domain protein n=1 Tax=Nocardioides marmoribigeumensis TaxID=433649 RepID=A0ABU2BZZ2_9ACTN|nr:SpoIID/LytB domain-containing protein [Nocardioides marmoribigeumensis]MDR7363977.1 SpoIID/LytB domain protein [Nocardioides marmoribigeumensis]